MKKNKDNKKGIILKNKIKDFINNNKNTIIVSLPFILMHLFITIMAFKVKYNFYNYFAPLFFSVTWSILFVGLSLKLRTVLGKIFYIVLNLIFISLFFINGVYFSIMDTFFDFNLIESAKEGAPYVLDSLKNCNKLVYLATILLIVSVIFGIKYFPNKKKGDFKGSLIIIVIFTFMHLIAPLTLGKENKELTWSNWRNARNIYTSYNDNNKSLKVSGFYEYEIRNFYITFLKTKEQENEEEIEFLDTAFAAKERTTNKFTGIFKDKNLIIIQLEGMDNWIVSEEVTPTISKLMKEGINFNNHYSFYNGGGSTFNSEFAINTGFVTPYSYNRNAYSFNKNYFPYTLAKLFSQRNYKINAFHMNTGEYYSRTINYKNWGYENFYGLKDLNEYSDSAYELDRELILNETFNKIIFNEEDNFVDYIITYSGHLPFTNTKGVCKMLYMEDIDKEMEKKKQDLLLTKQIEEDIDKDEVEDKIIEIERPAFKEMSEEECVKRQNKETDYMVELLINNLKEKNLLDKTVLLFVTDHYLYTLEDKSILDKYKDTSNNLINKTPFFIWANGITPHNVNSVTTQLDILPTILNLFDINYNPNNYIGSDALSNSYKGIAFFSDYSWFDGQVYVDNGIISNGKNISVEELENKNYQVSYLTKKNDLALKYNYFNRKK